MPNTLAPLHRSADRLRPSLRSHTNHCKTLPIPTSKSSGNNHKPTLRLIRSEMIAATIAMNAMVIGSRSHTSRALLGDK